ncbi:hypothetical protein CEXT_141791 [Caerostris extrusa]|uniref:Secreted protein n=1 Tax=Caerostris extrusa TaxID=172846 RepID=A0AAV4XBK9_CAEEX|nr:hypothetical protein CEXT_141791 [Caerostris extrusa]
MVLLLCSCFKCQAFSLRNTCSYKEAGNTFQDILQRTCNIVHHNITIYLRGGIWGLCSNPFISFNSMEEDVTRARIVVYDAHIQAYSSLCSPIIDTKAFSLHPLSFLELYFFILEANSLATDSLRFNVVWEDKRYCSFIP